MKVLLPIALCVVAMCSLLQAEEQKPAAEEPLLEYADVTINPGTLPEQWHLFSEDHIIEWGYDENGLYDDTQEEYDQRFDNGKDTVIVRYFKQFTSVSDDVLSKFLREYANTDVVVRKANWIFVIDDKSNAHFDVFMKALDVSEFDFIKLKGAGLDRRWIFLNEIQWKPKAIEKFASTYNNAKVTDVYTQAVWVENALMKITYVFCEDDRQAQLLRAMLAADDDPAVTLFFRENIVYGIHCTKQYIRDDVSVLLKETPLPEKEKSDDDKSYTSHIENNSES